MMDNMKSSDIFNLMSDVIDRFGGRYGKAVMDGRLSMKLGSMKDDGYGVIFRVGVKELLKDSDREWPIGQAMVPIVGLFHQVCGHGMQIGCEFNKAVALSAVLALNYYACHMSPAYYGCFADRVTEQYRGQPHEVAAQYVGVREAYGFLSEVYGKEEANHMILEYEKVSDWRQMRWVGGNEAILFIACRGGVVFAWFFIKSKSVHRINFPGQACFLASDRL